MSEPSGDRTREVDSDQPAPGPGREREPRECTPILVKVHHGHLNFVQAPVAVGHYNGDTIVGSERALDRILGGRLRLRRRLGLYPGPLETADVVLCPPEEESDVRIGALVVGLGDVGSLTYRGLIKTFRRAILTFAVHLIEASGNATDENDEEDEDVEWIESSSGERVKVRTLSLATLLIGSGDGGLPVEDCLGALLEGAASANRALLTLRADLPAQLRSLGVVELYFDRAVEAAKILQGLSVSARHRCDFQFSGRVERLGGGLERISVSRDRSWWRRLQIRQMPDGALKFTALSDRARADERLLFAQREVVDSFIESAVRDSSAAVDLPILGRSKKTTSRARKGSEAAEAAPAKDPAFLAKAWTSTTLYRLLVPKGLHHFVDDFENLLLVVDEETARYPWELLDDQPGPPFADADEVEGKAASPETEDSERRDLPIAVRAGVIRQLVTEQSRELIVPPQGKAALVVGDPRSDLKKLPGAQEEAIQVSDLLVAQGYEVTSLVRADHESVFAGLWHRPYRVIHLAGHGVFQMPLGARLAGPKDEDRAKSPKSASTVTVTGMVIGKGIYLTAAELEQMATVPELVFVNCCHLGQTGEKGPRRRWNQPHLLAASFATQLIRMGVRAVVAAGWAVSDGAAQQFASVFYGQMLAGRSFGMALKEARAASFNDFRDSTTWGAYQAYGDPEYRLDPSKESADPRGAGKDGFVAKGEALVALRNLASAAATTSDYGIEALRTDLDAAIQRIPEELRTDSEIRVALARVHRELDDIEEAIAQITGALGEEKSQVSMRALEYRCNLRGHNAIRRWLRAEDEREARAEAVRELNHCLAEIEKLPCGTLSQARPKGLTEERLALMGSCHKRLALVLPARLRKNSIAEATELYRTAHERHEKRQGEVDLYPYLNYLSCCVVQFLREEQALPEDFRTSVVDALELLKRRNRETRTYWNLVHQAELGWLVGLAEGDLEARLVAIRKRLKAAWIRAGTMRQARTVYEQLYWLEAVIKPPRGSKPDDDGPPRHQGYQALGRLRDLFETMVGEELGDPNWVRSSGRPSSAGQGVGGKQ